MKTSDIEYIVVHCSASRFTDNIDAAAIDRMHKAKGWDGIGYHFVILPDGRIEIGRALDKAGAHAYGFNSKSWGVCCIGGLNEHGEPENTLTDKQAISLKKIIDVLLLMQPGAEVLGHRDLFGDTNKDGVIDSRDWLKECPCFDVREWLKNVS